MKVERLFITEKPDMAKCLAAGLMLAYDVKVINPGKTRDDGCIILSNGDHIGFFFGHMLELAPPEAYLTEAQNRGNAFEYLPLFPPSLIKYPKRDRNEVGKAKLDKQGIPLPSHQFKRMAEMVKSAREIVNAGDTDREGQLIVDEFLSYVGVDPAGKTKPVWRLDLRNPDENEIKKLVLKGFEKNSDSRWALKGVSGHIRQMGDFCLGMTASRAYRQVTGYSRMAIGRVSTPTLAMVVRRELAIQKFTSVEYFIPVITLADGTKMRWMRRQGAEGLPGFDIEGRITDEAVARQIVAAITGKNDGNISQAHAQKKYQPPPLPFSMGTLQSTVSRRYGMSLKEVSAAAQALYERHGMITYVGTDCQFLPTSMLNQAADTVKSLSASFRQEANGANIELISKAWNDSKTDEHSAIAPTGKASSGSLTTHEKNVFETVSRRFLAQFYPNHEYVTMGVQAVFGKDEFKATEKSVSVNGWKDAEYGSEGDASGDELDSEVEIEVEKVKGISE